VPRARAAIGQLVAVFLAVGHDGHAVNVALQDLGRKYPSVLSPSFLQPLLNVVMSPRTTAVLEKYRNMF